MADLDDKNAQDSLKALIFAHVGITNTAAWKGKSSQEMLIELRENTGCTYQEINKACRLSGEELNQIERKTAWSDELAMLLAFYKPRLMSRASSGWLVPEQFTLNPERCEELALACKYLRQATGKTQPEFTKALQKKNLEAFDVSRFEADPMHRPNGSLRPVAQLQSIADRLCEFYKQHSLEDLLAQANKVAQEYNHPHYVRGDHAKVGKALGAWLEYLDIGHKKLCGTGVFSSVMHISGFINGTSLLAADKILRIPELVMQTYRDEYHGANPPKIAHCAHIGDLLEKGGRLAAINKDYIRIGLQSLMEKTGKSENDVSSHAGYAGTGGLSGFLYKRGRNANRSTCHLQRYGAALGVPDIFELEAIGKAAVAGRAESHVLGALARMIERGEFKER